jgi:hypothetical protein
MCSRVTPLFEGTGEVVDGLEELAAGGGLLGQDWAGGRVKEGVEIRADLVVSICKTM